MFFSFLENILLVSTNFIVLLQIKFSKQSSFKMLVFTKKIPLLFLYLIFFLVSTTVFSQEVSSRYKIFNQKMLRYQSKNQLDSISFVSEKFLRFKDLNDLEKQLVYYHKAKLYHKINRFNDEIQMLKKALDYYIPTNKTSIQINDLCCYMLADVLFTKRKFGESFFYAKKIENKPFINQNADSYIIIHAILGYCYFLKLDYPQSISQYQLAEKRAITSAPCQLPMVYSKQAKVLSRQNNFYDAKKIILKSIKISDSCKETINKINALKAWREILVENGKFQEANTVFDDLDSLKADKKIDLRNSKIDSLETVFDTKLKEIENKSLLKINDQKNNQILTQRKILIGAFLGLFVLSTLLYFLFRLSIKQKKLNEVLQVQTKTIEQSNANLERLNLLNQKIFSVISHDLKAPMINLELLIKSDKSESLFLEKKKEKIANNLSQANLIIDNLMSWSKSELGMSYDFNENTNTFETVSKVIFQLDSLLVQKKLEVINEIPTNKFLKIPEDTLMIIFRNIINNAIKFSFEDNNIVVGFNEKTNEFSVHDFGIGMSENQMQTLFNDKSISKLGTNQETGFGIGLQFVYELILQNNGKIRVESVLNEGTIFYVSF